MPKRPASEETVAGLGPSTETERLALDYPTTGQQEAWSAEEPGTELIEPQSWRLAWGFAAILLACASIIAFVVGIVGWLIFVNTRGDVPALDPGATTPTLMKPALPPTETVKLPPKPRVDPLDGGAWVAGAVSPLSIFQHRNDHDANFGGSAAEPTQKEATTVALKQCAQYTGNDDCELLNEGVHHGCVAYMIDPSNGHWAGGIGNTLEEAIDAASKALGAHHQPWGDGKCGTHAGEGPR